MQKKAIEAREINNPRRFNFNSDLKALKALFNWYRENYDGLFVNPVLKRHFVMGQIKIKPKGQAKKMNLDQVRLFLDSFQEQLWRDFAELHFFMAGRVQEIGGLQFENVDLERAIIRVADVAIWGRDKKFYCLKEIPKNSEERIVHLNHRMREILLRRLNDRFQGETSFKRESSGRALDFVFHLEGIPVSYRQVQHHYNRALKRAGLFPQFQSTHILRKAMANLVRRELGLDAAQAAGGWKSRSVVEKCYTDAPNELGREAVMHIEKLFGQEEKRLRIV